MVGIAIRPASAASAHPQAPPITPGGASTSVWHLLQVTSRPVWGGNTRTEADRSCSQTGQWCDDPAHLLRDFDRGAERLAGAGYTEVARFKNRARRMEALESAVPA